MFIKSNLKVLIKALIILSMLAVLGVACLFFYGSHFIFQPCAKNIYTVLLSPDKKISAFVGMTDCGATTSFNRQVVVENLATGEQKMVLSVKGEPQIDMIWENENTLKVISKTPIKQQDIYDRKSIAFQNIHIKYSIN